MLGVGPSCAASEPRYGLVTHMRFTHHALAPPSSVRCRHRVPLHTAPRQAIIASDASRFLLPSGVADGSNTE